MSGVSSFAAAAGIFRVGAMLHDARTGVVAVVLWSALPVSVVQSMAYTESLFTALAAWALHAVLARRYVAAGAWPAWPNRAAARAAGPGRLPGLREP